jgi:hypothetical protein
LPSRIGRIAQTVPPPRPRFGNEPAVFAALVLLPSSLDPAARAKDLQDFGAGRRIRRLPYGLGDGIAVTFDSGQIGLHVRRGCRIVVLGPPP